METMTECLKNADMAYDNEQYEEALKWYKKVLDDNSEDVYVLSKAGAICASLGKFLEARDYFGKAKDIDSENGDNYFNFANACFFNENNVEAFENYVEAERKGCSDDVTPRLYYQLGLICSMRQDIKSALVYFRKCEEYDKTGTISLNPDLISERIKLYMIQEDYENAEKYAAQYVDIQPSQLNSYVVYFSVLMANKKYDTAEKVLADAKSYAEMSPEDGLMLDLQLATFYVVKGEEEHDDTCYARAIELLAEVYKRAGLEEEQVVSVLLTMGEVYLKAEKYDSAIQCLCRILTEHDSAYIEKKIDKDDFAQNKNVNNLSYEDIEKMIFYEVNLIQEKIYTGEIDENAGLYAQIDYDEYGQEVRVYGEHFLYGLFEDRRIIEEDNKDNEAKEGHRLSEEIRENVYFLLLSAYIGKDDYSGGEKYSVVLKHSNNIYYSYFGLYTTALINRKIHGDTAETREIYDRAVAFFRNKMFADINDSLAAVFRARLYAEGGKKEKAREIAMLLSDEDKKAVLDYIETCE